MDQDFSLHDHLEELDLVVDSLFTALRQFLRIDDTITQNTDWYGTSYAREAWRTVPNNIRAVILALIYATYTSTEEVPEAILQWRKDVYAELDEVATKPRHLRKVK